MLNEIAKCFITIGADQAPLKSVLGGLASTMTGPISGAANQAAQLLTGSFGTMTEGLSEILRGNVGKAVEQAGNFITGSAGKILSKALQTVLGETIGGAIGNVIEKTISGLSGVVFSTLGKSINAVLHPVQMALAASPGDFDLWVSKSIQMEQSMAKFNATVKATGGVTGWTADQMKIMREQMSEKTGFGKGDLAEAQESLMRSGLIRGDTFKQALEGATSMAAMFGGGAAEAAHTLAYALSEPEIGIRRLARSTHIFTQEQMASIKEMAKGGDLAGAQAAILGVVSSKGSGVASAMANTVQGQLDILRRQWEGLWREAVGDSFLPLVRLVTDASRGVVGALKEIVGPMAAEVKKLFTGWASNAHAWLADNAGTFKKWSADIAGIAMNVFNLLSDGLNRVFGGSAGDTAQKWWASFSDGVSKALEFIRAFTTDLKNFELAWNVVWLSAKDKAISAFESVSDNWATFLEGLGTQMKSWVTKFGDFLATALPIIFGGATKAAAKSSWTAWKDFFDFGDDFEQRKRNREMRELTVEKELAGKGLSREDRLKAAFDTAFAPKAGEALGGDDAKLKTARAEAAAERKKNLDTATELFWLSMADSKEKNRLAKQKGGGLGDSNAPGLPGGPGAMTFTGYEAFAKQIQEQLGGGGNAAEKTATNTEKTAKLLEELPGKLVGIGGSIAVFG